MLWCFCCMTVVNFYIVTFLFREDERHPDAENIFSTLKGLKDGMFQIWFRFRPGAFVIPVTIVFFMYVLCWGGSKLMLIIYLRAPPFSLTNDEYGAFNTFVSVTYILAAVLQGFVQKWKFTEYQFVIFAVISFICNQMVYAFGSTKGI